MFEQWLGSKWAVARYILIYWFGFALAVAFSITLLALLEGLICHCP